MKFLTADESTAWWRKNILPDVAAISTALKPGPKAALETGVLDPDRLPASTVRFLAVSITRWLTEFQSPLMILWVRETGIWQSSEDRCLYAVWRRSHGDCRTVEDAPGHVMEHHEGNDLSSLALMCLTFGWGFVAASPRRAVEIDHDGHIRIVGESSESAQELRDRLVK